MDKLPWTRYKYVARSGEVKVVGLLQLHYYPTAVQVSRIALERVARNVQEENQPWDPFNCELVVVRVRDPFTQVELLSKEQFQQLLDAALNETNDNE